MIAGREAARRGSYPDFRAVPIGHSRPHRPVTLVPMAQCEAGWSTASCAKCAGHGQVAGSDGFVACAECGGSGKTSAPSCCARHDHPDDAHRGEVAYESVAELIKVLDLEDSEGNPAKASEAFEGKVVGLYFSAMHCPACQRFSPKLAAFTHTQSADYVTVLVSGDANEEAFEGYRRAHVGCFAVPFHSPHRQMLMSAFRIFAIPALHVWHPAMSKAVTGWGHTAVTYNADECVRDWHRGEPGYSLLGSLFGVGKLPQCAPPGL